LLSKITSLHDTRRVPVSLVKVFFYQDDRQK
jgi:hypothetical protein